MRSIVGPSQSTLATGQGISGKRAERSRTGPDWDIFCDGTSWRLGFTAVAGNKHWNSKEADIVRKHYPHVSNADLARALPGRSPRAILSHANRMGLLKHPERLREVGKENMAKRWGGETPAA